MNNTDFISVIIPAKNTAPWIEEQLDSLSAQIDSPEFEVIIADNGSTDGTKNIVENYTGTFGKPILIDASGPSSASYARNIAAQNANGNILMFCDSDDFVDSHWVSELYNAFQESEGQLVSGVLYHEKFNSPEILYGYNIPNDPARIPEETLDADDVMPFAGYLPTAPGGNFAIATADYLVLNGMDYSFPGGSEETDFSWRAQENGLKLVRAPRAIVYYRLKNSFSGIFRQQRIQQRARIYLWTLYKEKGMTGPSLKWSLIQIFKEQKRIPFIFKNKAELYRYAWVIGANIGAIEGIFKYKFLKGKK